MKTVINKYPSLESIMAGGIYIRIVQIPNSQLLPQIYRGFTMNFFNDF